MGILPCDSFGSKVAMSVTRSDAMNIVWRSLKSSCTRFPLALVREEFLRTHAAECLLQSGAALLEASNVGATLNQIQLIDGRLRVSEIASSAHSNVPATTLKRGRGKPSGTVTSDIRLASPRLHVEIKARCAFASSNGNLSAPLVKDLQNAINGVVDALFLAIDASVYERLRSDRVEKRGDNRSPEDSAFFDSVFEHVDSVPDGAEASPPCYAELQTTRGRLLRRQLKLGNTYAEKRILLCFAHPEPAGWLQ